MANELSPDSQIHCRTNHVNPARDVFSVDVILESYFQPLAPAFDQPCSSGSALLFQSLSGPRVSTPTKLCLKLLLPARSGYVSRSDMLQFRMTSSSLKPLIFSFLGPRQQVKSVPLVAPESLQPEALFDLALGILIPLNQTNSDDSLQLLLQSLESELEHRLAIPWLLPDPIAYQRVALLGGLPETHSLASVQAMGIGLIILDQPGNCFEDPSGPLAHLREEFVPFDMNEDGHVAQRLVDALRDKSIAGIHTRYDIHHANVAEASKLLGLPGSPPESYRIATDKYAARMMELDQNSAFCATDPGELRNKIAAMELHYPLVVKPTSGRNSWSVLRVDSEVELLEAARLAYSRVICIRNGQPVHPKIMVEPYIDGPEFDVNLVLWNGELLSFEVSDNFPCAGDLFDGQSAGFTHTSHAKDFQETLFVFPSALVAEEQRVLADSLHKSVLRLGFRCGVFHVEARLCDSQMEYRVQDSTYDLHMRRDASTHNGARTFLIEVNPRPPGYGAACATAWTFGIDYWALHVLRCIGDEKRFRAFSKPIVRDLSHAMALTYIMPNKGGVLKSCDSAVELAARRPDLMSAVPFVAHSIRQGEYVRPPDAPDFQYLSKLLVESHKGRLHLLELVRDIRGQWRFDID